MVWDGMTKTLRCLSELGWNSTWDSEDREACRAHHAELFRELKLRLVGKTDVALEDIPGMLDSLQCLLDMGYSFTDMAVMFGVSRQRVGQWCDRHGLEDPDGWGAAYRVWDDELHQFVSVTREEMNDRARLQLELRKDAERTRRREAKRRRHVATLRRLHEELGRVPTQGELARELGFAGHGQGAARYWLGVNGAESYTEAFTQMYHAAGLEKRTRGGSGHT